MTTFTLGTKENAFELDPLGGVFENGAPAGAWRTTPDNRIQVRRAGFDDITFEVAWKFNPDNQLTLLAGGREIFNFHQDSARQPSFETRNAVLRVAPNKSGSFIFELRGDWEFTADHDLAFTINGERSLLKGVLSDPLGRFLYYFAEKARPLVKHRLGFVGTWENAPGREGGLIFRYRREDGSSGVFRLPGAVTIRRDTNQLRYEYNKNGTQAVDLTGTLMINPDFSISYALNRQMSASGELVVRETTLSFDAVYSAKDFTGDLELTLTRPDGSPGSTRLAIRGTYTAVRGETNLQVGFTFDQVRAGQTLTTTFGFDGELAWRGGSVQWTFATDNAASRTMTLSLGSQIQIGDAQLDSRLNLEVTNGRFQGVTFLLGMKL